MHHETKIALGIAAGFITTTIGAGVFLGNWEGRINVGCGGVASTFAYWMALLWFRCSGTMIAKAATKHTERVT